MSSRSRPSRATRSPRTGFDPRTLPTPYAYTRLTPRVVKALREADEPADRDLIRDGRWLS